MRDRTRAPMAVARWLLFATAVVLAIVFVTAQGQSADISYGRSPSSQDDRQEGSAGELSDATVPSVEEMNALVRAEPVVRLPGSIAHWNEDYVRDVIGDSKFRILVTPPGLDEDERDRVREVGEGEDFQVIRVMGTHVSGSPYEIVPDRISEWRPAFATGDVTNLLAQLIAALDDQEEPPGLVTFRWREPTPAELDTVAADLRADGLHIAQGATLERVPEKSAATAFPGSEPLVVALPQQPFGEPVPRYAPALAERFPGRPVVVMYGSWIEYDGPHATDFAELVAAGLYSQLDSRLARYDYPQGNVLNAWLNRVTDVRYSGLFDRPLPYVPCDPLKVTMPALPWVFAACVLGFLALSVRPLRRASVGPARPPARMAGLTALAIEMSGLTDERSNPSLTRGIAKLDAAKDALEAALGDRQIGKLLDAAERELDETARLLGRQDYRPHTYLAGRLA